MGIIAGGILAASLLGITAVTVWIVRQRREQEFLRRRLAAAAAGRRR